MLETLVKTSFVRTVGLTAGLLAGIVGFSGKASAQEAPDCRPYPGVAYANGANGTFWGADFVLSNPHTEVVSGVIIYTPRNVSRGTGQDLEISYNLIPHEALQIEKLVESLLGGQQAVGQLCVKPDVGTLEPVGRLKSYNYDPDHAGAGRFGQTLEQEEWTYPDGMDIFTIGDLRERTNIILVTGPDGAVLTVDSYNPEGGAKIDTYTHYLEPNRYYQWSSANGLTGAERFADVALPPGSSLVVHNVGGSAILWGSVVNNITGDGYSPRFNNLARGTIPEPNNEPPYLTCLRSYWLSSHTDFCDTDSDGDIEETINPSARGPSPSGPNLFEWLGEDPEGDEFWVEALNGTLPDYATLEGRNLTIDPSDEHVGQDFFVDFRACDAYGCGPQMVVHFNIVN